MAGDDRLIESLRAAVEATPGDTALRLHLAELLLARGARDEAVRHLGRVLQDEPGSRRALELLSGPAPAQGGDAPEPRAPAEDVDWAGLEAELADVVPPMFVEGRDEEPTEDAYEVEREQITLADVGGLADVKERLEVAFLAPLRNPELRRLYRKDLRGGLLLYGPPGCGKGFIARALAGELGAGFMSVSIDDVLDMYVGTSERNLHEIFMTARRKAPTVLFFDELDALGRRRSQLSNNAMRTTVNQLLHELDGVDSGNENVFVLGATNHPWDVDPALRRPGRFDRTLLVLPPDEAAREAIFRTHLEERPIANIDPRALARRTDGYSGADIAHICDTAAERALTDALRTNDVRLIEMRDLEGALAEVRPSINAWFELARNVVSFSNKDGTYDDLHAYMKARKLA
jgi:SpoVK/Ycf46/Vps4 family AAA+-type ATPase